MGGESRRRLSAEANHSSVAKRTCDPASWDVAFVRDWEAIRADSSDDVDSLADRSVVEMVAEEEIEAAVWTGLAFSLLLVVPVAAFSSEEFLRTFGARSSNRRPDTLSRCSRVGDDFCIMANGDGYLFDKDRRRRRDSVLLIDSIQCNVLWPHCGLRTHHFSCLWRGARISKRKRGGEFGSAARWQDFLIGLGALQGLAGLCMQT